MNSKLTLIRHGAIDAAYDHRYIGRTNASLSDEGLQQAERLAERLASGDVDSLWASPMLRAQQTAMPIAEKLALPVKTVSELQEVDFGRWEGLTFEQICADAPDQVQAWADFAPDFCFPGGEPHAQFLARVKTIGLLLKEAPGQHVAVVTHGGIIRSLLCHLLGLEPCNYLAFEMGRGSITTLSLYEGQGVLTGLINDI